MKIGFNMEFMNYDYFILLKQKLVIVFFQLTCLLSHLLHFNPQLYGKIKTTLLSFSKINVLTDYMIIHITIVNKVVLKELSCNGNRHYL